MPNPARKLTLDQTLEALEIAASLKVENRMAFFKPYPKQAVFCELGVSKRERLLMAGNQVGKSEVGAFEAACHMTGEYPPGWRGKVFKKPTRGWIAGETSLVVRDVQQKKLCGEPGVDSALGTGMIPKDRFSDKPSMARGITDAFDTIQVRHKSGGVSIGRFKSYEQGRTKFQGETLDWCWCDEEPPEDIYAEAMARLTGTGIIYTTFTPLKGRSKVVLRFLDEQSSDRAVVVMTLDDAEHFTAEEKSRRLSGYLAHEKEARAKGIPIMGSGSVYQFPEELIREQLIENLPQQWFKLWGVDFGIDHPFGAVLMAWDKDSDIIHILHTIRQVGTLPLMDATAMRNIAAAVPVAWPHDGHLRQQGSDTADELAVVYRKHGLSMLADHATFESGGFSREAAVME